MLTVHPQYITDHTGKKISVVLPVKEFDTILEDLEELEDIRLYDLAKAKNERTIPLRKAIQLRKYKENKLKEQKMNG